MNFEIVTIELDQCFPAESFRDGTRFVEGCLRLLIGHFQEKQIGQLLHIIAVGKTVIPQDVAIIPKLLNQLLWITHFEILFCGSKVLDDSGRT